MLVKINTTHSLIISCLSFCRIDYRVPMSHGIANKQDNAERENKPLYIDTRPKEVTVRSGLFTGRSFVLATLTSAPNIAQHSIAWGNRGFVGDKTNISFTLSSSSKSSTESEVRLVQLYWLFPQPPKERQNLTHFLSAQFKQILLKFCSSSDDE